MKTKNISNKVIFLFVFIFWNFIYIAQAQNRVWLFPYQQLDFPVNGGAPVLNSISQPLPWVLPQQSYNAMQDANGNPIFYFVDGTIYDANGLEMDFISNPNSLMAGVSVKGYPETCIVPVPGSCTQYYIITADAYGTIPNFNPSTFYVTLDMTVPNISSLGYGSLIGPNSTNIVPGGGYDVHCGTMHLAVSRLRPSSNDRFLFVADNANLFRFLITTSGIVNATSVTGLTIGYNGKKLQSEIELYQDNAGNYMIGNIELSTPGSFLVIYNLDQSGNIISSSSQLISTSQNSTPHGLEFSPDGQYLYFTNTISPFVQYCHITSGVLDPISTLNISTANEFKDSQIELGFDGKLYFAAEHRLATLSIPNSPNASNWNDNAVVIDVPVVTEFQMRVIQDQIDGENYGSTVSSIATPECCDHNELWDQIEYNTSGNATWTSTTNPLNGGTGSTAWIKGTLTIPSNSNIVIDGMILHFGINGKISIQPGGSLTIDGTTLTGNDRCQTMWQGVEVIGVGQNGSPNLSQQGRFISQNSSVIEQAISGLINNTLVSPNANNCGGYLQCISTTFNNCYGGIIMWGSVTNAGYSSVITSCTFTSTALWYPHANARSNTHVALFDVKGGSSSGAGVDIVFNNILSPNARTSFNNADHGVGCVSTERIVLSNADFNNCGIGLESIRLSFQSKPTSSIFFGLQFNECNTGIKLGASSGDHIHDNIFNAQYGTANLGSQNVNFYGIFADASSDFHITDNILNHLRYGILCRNSVSIRPTTS